MIDTIKIISAIDYNAYTKIKSSSIIKTAYHSGTGEVYYQIINDSLEGSYSSSLSVRVGESKYNFYNSYYIEIEGSYHKIIRGYNSHEGFYNLISVSLNLIKMVVKAYQFTLPTIKHWFLQRVDIAKCFDLGSQEVIQKYINSLNSCNYPRRKLKHYEGESIYLTGATTTLKIYNKLKEFEKHDKKKFKNSDFDIQKYLNTIKGFIRFECEIKKRKLSYIFKKNYIRVCNVSYNDLKNIFDDEFRKFFKILQNDLELVYAQENVKLRLESLYKEVRARNLFNFYLVIQVRGLQEVKRDTNRSMYYKNISDLKKAKIDFTQKSNLDLTTNTISFNPFEAPEVM